MKKILIVDDNHHLISYLENKLREAGHEVHTAMTGLSAIKMLTGRGVTSSQVLNLNSIVVACRHLPEFEKLSSYHAAVRQRWG